MIDNPVVAQAIAALITAVATAILLWASWRFPRDHHYRDDEEEGPRRGA